MSTVLVLGAGLTRAASSARSRAYVPPLDSDFFSIARLVDRPRHDRVVRSLDRFGGEYSKVLCRSLETSATYLYLKALDGERRDPFHSGFIDLLKLLNAVLAQTTNGVSSYRSSLLYRFLLNELSLVDNPEDLTIITFNYDLVVDRVLQEIARANRPDVFSFPGCYRLSVENPEIRAVQRSPQFDHINEQHEGIALLKLHGSMNWQSSHRSNEPTPSELYGRTRSICLVNSPEISPRLRVRRGGRTLHMKPVIVPPVNGKKGVMHEAFTGIWDAASSALQGASRVVIAGYSCPPLDIEARILLSENLRPNPLRTVYVIDPNAASASKFSDICGVDHLTIYGGLDQWVSDYSRVG